MVGAHVCCQEQLHLNDVQEVAVLNMHFCKRLFCLQAPDTTHEEPIFHLLFNEANLKEVVDADRSGEESVVVERRFSLLSAQSLKAVNAPCQQPDAHFAKMI